MPFAINGKPRDEEYGSEKGAKPRDEEYDDLQSSKANHGELHIANQKRESGVSQVTRDLV